MKIILTLPEFVWIVSDLLITVCSRVQNGSIDPDILSLLYLCQLLWYLVQANFSKLSMLIFDNDMYRYNLYNLNTNFYRLFLGFYQSRSSILATISLLSFVHTCGAMQCLPYTAYTEKMGKTFPYGPEILWDWRKTWTVIIEGKVALMEKMVVSDQRLKLKNIAEFTKHMLPLLAESSMSVLVYIRSVKYGLPNTFRRFISNVVLIVLDHFRNCVNLNQIPCWKLLSSAMVL